MRHLIKLLIGLTLLFWLYSCEKDIQLAEDKTQYNTPLVLNQKIAFEEALHFNLVQSKISDIEKRIRRISIDNTNYRIGDNETIEILTDEVLYITYASTHTYSFRVLREFPEAFIENIVLHYNVETGDYDEYFVQYNVSAEEFVMLHDGGMLQSSEHVTITNLENGFFGSQMQNRDCDRVCNTIFVACSSGEHNASNVGEWGNCTENMVNGGTLPYAYQSCSSNCDQDNEITPPTGDSSSGGGGNTTVVSNPFTNPPCETSTSGSIGMMTSNGGCLSEELMITEIKDCINSSSDLNDPTTIDDGILEQLNLSFSELTAINNYLNINSCSLEAQEFVILAIEALEEGGEVDWEEKIINGLEGKALCIYNKLISLSTSFKDMIQKFDEEFPVAHLKFEIDTTMSSNTQKAYTRPPEDYVIDIVLNGNPVKDASYQKRPNLLVVKTIIHEVIHAEIFRKILSLANDNGEIDVALAQQMLQQGDYPGILDYYIRFGINEFQHQQMAAHYRETIGKILQEFDTGIAVPDNQQPQQLYLDLAWEGLIYSNIVEWQNVMSDEERTQIQNTISNYISENLNENCSE